MNNENLTSKSEYKMNETALKDTATGNTKNTTTGTTPDWQLLAPRLLSWYDQNARQLPWREAKDPYQIWVSEIMLQQTRAEAVRGYYARFMDELPDVAALASCPEDRLLKLWEGLGYYSRARNLKKAAEQIMDLYEGKLPADHKQLLKLPGIGPYTAGAIASIAFDIPVPAVDGNVLRVRARVFGDDGDIADSAVKKAAEAELLDFMQEFFPKRKTISQSNVSSNEASFSSDGASDSLCGSLVPSEDTSISPGAFNQALMDLGATVCLPNGMPHCDICPWNELCIAHQNNLTSELPVKKKKAPRRIEDKTVLMIMDGERIVLQKRPEKGLLAGLYELPNRAGHLSKDDALKEVQELGLAPLRITALAPAKHIFTHIEWHMIGYIIRVDSLTSESSGLLFAEQEDVKTRYSIPSAFDAYIGHIKNNSFDYARPM